MVYSDHIPDLFTPGIFTPSRRAVDPSRVSGGVVSLVTLALKLVVGTPNRHDRQDRRCI